jgi:hypothetical protein
MLNSFVGQMMVSAGHAAIAETNGLIPFEVRVLEPIRTLCEKIMSLVRFSYGENPISVNLETWCMGIFQKTQRYWKP